jgi:hypothetical protein
MRDARRRGSPGLDATLSTNRDWRIQMSNEKKQSDVTEQPKTKLPAVDGNTVEEIPAADLDEVAGGADCNGTCKDTKVSLRQML